MTTFGGAGLGHILDPFFVRKMIQDMLRCTANSECGGLFVSLQGAEPLSQS